MRSWSILGKFANLIFCHCQLWAKSGLFLTQLYTNYDENPKTIVYPNFETNYNLAPFYRCSWFITPWSHCSKTCGKGTCSREIICSIEKRNGMENMSENNCRKPKPSVPLTKSCNAIMCLAEWNPIPWSQVCLELF